MATEPSTARLISAMAALDRAPAARDDGSQGLPPPLVLADEEMTFREMVRRAFAEPVADRRLGWALLRVAELALDGLERQRIMEDDRPELALAGWRRWCLGGPPQSLYDAYNDLAAVTAAARDVSHPLFIACMGIEQLALAARSAQQLPPSVAARNAQLLAAQELLVTQAIEAAIFGLDLRETYDVATARVENELRLGLTERGPTGDAPGGTRRNPGEDVGPRAHRRPRVIASEVAGEGPGLERWRFSVDGLRGAYAYLEHGSPSAVARYLLTSGLPEEAACVQGLAASAVGYLSGIEVPPDHHSRGFGTAMMEEVLRTAQEAGVECVVLDALPTAPATREMLVRFYERSGFSVWDGCGGSMPFMILRLRPSGRR